MRFGPVPLAQAAGEVLAHSQPLNGRVLKKGTILESDDIEALRAAGHSQVTVARLAAGDIDENGAAEAMARALAPDADACHLRLGGAHSGRVNLYATAPGVLALDVDALHGANRVDAMITIATLAPYARTRADGMVATVKIISYGVAHPALTRAATLARGAMTVKTPLFGDATLIVTHTARDTTKADRKGKRATRARLAALGIGLREVLDTPHETAALAAAMTRAQGEMILILTASATSDIDDTAPAALRAAGGRVSRFGIPVDPGNLMFFGRLGQHPVIGLPGCARSLALNGADWVLERIACGLVPSEADIAAMGVGGLLKEIPTRPQLREG